MVVHTGALVGMHSRGRNITIIIILVVEIHQTTNKVVGCWDMVPTNSLELWDRAVPRDIIGIKLEVQVVQHLNSALHRLSCMV